MKAVLVEKINDFRIVDIPRPQPGKGEVLIKTAVTGLCRTDLKIIEVGHRDLVLPRVPGEEIVGTICAVGPDITSENLGQQPE
ncbi:MAG: alcohol dehydrogenase, partial [Candidatus Electrothrix sp. AR3]|nr:alcohol dehydrogenase [Candidatus Electrothrix sp. AR3]